MWNKVISSFNILCCCFFKKINFKNVKEEVVVLSDLWISSLCKKNSAYIVKAAIIGRKDLNNYKCLIKKKKDKRNIITSSRNSILYRKRNIKIEYKE